VKGRRGKRRKQLLEDIQERRRYWRGSNRSHPVENWFWNSLCNFRRTDSGINELMLEI